MVVQVLPGKLGFNTLQKLLEISVAVLEAPLQSSAGDIEVAGNTVDRAAARRQLPTNCSVQAKGKGEMEMYFVNDKTA